MARNRIPRFIFSKVDGFLLEMKCDKDDIPDWWDEAVMAAWDAFNAVRDKHSKE